MGRHHYRVTQRLHWIEGGRPGPGFTWVGGKPVTYEPGTTIVVDDRDVRSTVHCLDAIDAAGRAILERARAELVAPASVTPLATRQADGKMCLDNSPGSLHPTARAWLIRGTDEKLRQQGCILELVLKMLGRGDSPTRADLNAAARRAGEPPPAALLDHIFRRSIKRQRPGPRNPPHTTSAELAIKAYYQYALNNAIHRHEADSRCPRNVRDVAAAATARMFTIDERPISKRTVQRILASLASRSWICGDQKVVSE